MPPRRNPFVRYVPPKAPTTEQVAAALLFGAPTKEGQGRAEAVVARWTEGQATDPERSRRSKANAEAGRRYEALTRALYRRAGYTVTTSQFSQGAADLVAVSEAETLFIQVKSISA